MTDFSPKQQSLFTWMVFLIVPFMGMCIDIYVPSLPHMATALTASNNQVQWTIVFYQFGLAIGQLLAGPVSDAFGRGVTMRLSCLMQLALIALILSCHTVYAIISLRLLQGISIALLTVSARAILSDLFTGEVFRQKVNAMTIAFALGPIVSPAIGGYLQHHFNWQANFYFMLGYVCLVFLLLCFYKETHKPDYSLHWRKVCKGYRTLFCDTTMVAAICLGGVLVSTLVVFNLIAPFIVEEHWGYGPIFYGRVALLMGGFWLAGNLTNRFSMGVSFQKKGGISLGLTLFALITLAGAMMVTRQALFYLVFSSGLVIFSAAKLFPLLVYGALERFPTMAGLANGVLFSGLSFVAALVSQVAALFPATELVTLLGCFSTLTLLAVLMYFFSRRRFA